MQHDLKKGNQSLINFYAIINGQLTNKSHECRYRFI